MSDEISSRIAFYMMMTIYYFVLVCINISSKKDLTKAKTESREVNKALKFILSVIFVKLEELKLPLSQATWKGVRQWARCGKRERKQNCFLPGWENQILNYREICILREHRWPRSATPFYCILKGAEKDVLAQNKAGRLRDPSIH